MATLHDINNILFPEEEASSVPERVRRHMLTRGLRRAALVIAVSEATKRDAVTHLGLSAGRIEVVHNAIDEQVGRLVTEDERVEVLHRYQVRGPFVLYTGRIQPHKNIPRLIEAFAVAKAELENRPEYSDLTLIVIGDQSSAFPAVRHAVMRSRVQQSVRFLGFVPVETLRCFYEAATAFLFPSLYEGFGLPPWRRWLTARRSSPRTFHPCRKPWVMRPCWSTPRTSLKSRAGCSAFCSIKRCASSFGGGDKNKPGVLAGISQPGGCSTSTAA